MTPTRRRPLPRHQRAALERIAGAPRAWSRPEDVGIDPELLTELRAAGLVECWRCPAEGDVVTLTPLGAYRLRVRLSERRRRVAGAWAWTECWVPRGERDPAPREVHWASWRGDLDGLTLALARVADPAPGPVEAVLDEYTEQPVTLFGGLPLLRGAWSRLGTAPKLAAG